MRVSPIGPQLTKTVFEVPVVRALRAISRAEQTAEADALDDRQPEPDIKDGRQKRRPPRFAVPSSAAARSSPAVLAALIDLQEKGLR